MRFTVTAAGNNSTFGELFFTVPTPKTMDDAVREIATLCRNKAGELYGGMNHVVPRLETELALMRKTKTAYHFALLREIADLSREKGYPVMLLGNAAGSIISYLLGISSINPMKQDGYNISCDMVWGSFDEPIAPDFSMSIAAPIRPMIYHTLDKKFGFVKTEDALFNRISLPDSSLCENVGKLAKLTGQMPTHKQFGNDVCLQVVRNLSQDILDEICDMKENGYITEEEIPHPNPFVEELNQLDRCDLSTLLRIYAYRHASFNEAKTISNLSNKHFYVSRDEFYDALIFCNVPQDVALKTVGKGVWSITKTRMHYMNALKEYSVPDDILDYFDNVRNLWPVAACLSRLLLMCTIAWYQINCPVEFAKKERKNGT